MDPQPSMTCHDHQPPPRCFLILFNISKKCNVGNILRTASAFGVYQVHGTPLISTPHGCVGTSTARHNHNQVCIIGNRSFSTYGSHGADAHLDYRHFVTLEACCAYLHDEHHAQIIGIEITDNAYPVHAHPFHTNTAFMLGNEGTGLSSKQMALCDSFVYIPQHGQGTASLNVNVAAAIVLHHFACWAGTPEAPRTGFKYNVKERPLRKAARGTVPLTDEERQAERARRAALIHEEEDGSGLGMVGGEIW